MSQTLHCDHLLPQDVRGVIPARLKETILIDDLQRVGVPRLDAANLDHLTERTGPYAVHGYLRQARLTKIELTRNQTQSASATCKAQSISMDAT